MTASIDWAAANTEAIQHFKALLRIDTTNPPGNERAAADYIAGVLSQEGIDYSIVESEPTRASIVARLRGTGKKAPLLLSGHLDVVGVDREHWRHDPFAAVEADGCIWGRGAIDMKNMVTMSLMTLILLKRSGVQLDRDVIFAGVADEEAGSLKGSVFLVEQHPELIRAEYVLTEVGGHTLYMGNKRYYPIQVAEKGICWFELVASGEPGHGSMPHPKNAVVRLAKAIEALGNARLPQHNVPVVERFLKTLSQSANMAQKRVFPMLLNAQLAGMLLDVLAKSRPDQAASINAMLRNTATPTMLNAGNKINVIPSRASAHVDGRVIPGQSVQSFLDEVQAVVGKDIKVVVHQNHDGTMFSSDTPLFDAIAKGLKAHDPEGVPVPYLIPGFTDAFAYARLGATCYGFAPVRLPRDMVFTRMYHGHNERIPVDGFTWGFRLLHDVVEGFCKAG
jgi:acetylornithine deacetylase/succinyl-diaminopimelate desuccinylase-like protein